MSLWWVKSSGVRQSKIYYVALGSERERLEAKKRITQGNVSLCNTRTICLVLFVNVQYSITQATCKLMTSENMTHTSFYPHTFPEFWWHTDKEFCAIRGFHLMEIVSTTAWNLYKESRKSGNDANKFTKNGNTSHLQITSPWETTVRGRGGEMKILKLKAWAAPLLHAAVQFFRCLPPHSCWFWSMQIFRAPSPSPTIFSEPPFVGVLKFLKPPSISSSPT